MEQLKYTPQEAEGDESTLTQAHQEWAGTQTERLHPAQGLLSHLSIDKLMYAANTYTQFGAMPVLTQAVVRIRGKLAEARGHE